MMTSLLGSLRVVSKVEYLAYCSSHIDLDGLVASNVRIFEDKWRI